METKCDTPIETERKKQGNCKFIKDMDSKLVELAKMYQESTHKVQKEILNKKINIVLDERQTQVNKQKTNK